MPGPLTGCPDGHGTDAWVLLFTRDFDERDATTARRTYPGRRVLVNADRNLEVHPAGRGLPRSLLDR
ncbi:hypothetical protein ACFW81_07590 [Streptomyces angustmyceticus]|uniref:hypothetical protein n=1 Tax=Streptomyces angustmyceticus TaxID=285578 RepID=UPI0021AF5D36|nr:hypothetical protein [Streptomyces angustmyceticus]